MRRNRSRARGRLDDDREIDLGDKFDRVDPLCDKAMTRHRNARGAQHILHARLVAKVHRSRAGQTRDAQSFANEGQWELRLFVCAKESVNRPESRAEFARRPFKLRGIRNVVDAPMANEACSDCRRQAFERFLCDYRSPYPEQRRGRLDHL